MKDIFKELDFTNDVRYDIIVNKNRTLNQVIDCSLEENGEMKPFPFGDYDNIMMHVKSNYNSKHVVLALSNITDTIEMDNRGFLIFNVPEQLMNMRSGEYVYDIYIHKEGERKRAFMGGKFIVKDTVTN